MSNTQLEYLPEDFFDTFDRLITVDLSDNNMDSIPVELSDSTIKSLYFNNNPISSLEMHK